MHGKKREANYNEEKPLPMKEIGENVGRTDISVNICHVPPKTPLRSASYEWDLACVSWT
jgi:hypothetical protein